MVDILQVIPMHRQIWSHWCREQPMLCSKAKLIALDFHTSSQSLETKYLQTRDIPLLCSHACTSHCMYKCCFVAFLYCSFWIELMSVGLLFWFHSMIIGSLWILRNVYSKCSQVGADLRLFRAVCHLGADSCVFTVGSYLIYCLDFLDWNWSKNVFIDRWWLGIVQTRGIEKPDGLNSSPNRTIHRFYELRQINLIPSLFLSVLFFRVDIQILTLWMLWNGCENKNEILYR